MINWIILKFQPKTTITQLGRRNFNPICRMNLNLLFVSHFRKISEEFGDRFEQRPIDFDAGGGLMETKGSLWQQLATKFGTKAFIKRENGGWNFFFLKESEQILQKMRFPRASSVCVASRISSWNDLKAPRPQTAAHSSSAKMRHPLRNSFKKRR